jgi:hypothetical protein
MLGSSIYLALPRRISVLTLLFGMGAVLWILVCSLLATQSLVLKTELNTRLTPSAVAETAAVTLRALERRRREL